MPQPWRLLDEIARVLRPGGALVLTAPHIWGLHEEPRDYYRFTPFGLRHLGQAAGLRVEAVKALAGYWVTAGARFTHYLRRLERLRLHPATRPLMALVQLILPGPRPGPPRRERRLEPPARGAQAGAVRRGLR